MNSQIKNIVKDLKSDKIRTALKEFEDKTGVEVSIEE